MLAWLGSQGTRAIALSCLLGVAIPGASSYVRPFLTETIFLLLTLAFLQVDIETLKSRLGQPLRLGKWVAWTMLGIPLIALVGLKLTGIADAWPDTLMIVIIVCAPPPLMSASAIATLIGLDGALSLALLIVSMVLTPLTAPLLASLFLPAEIALDTAGLIIRLSLLLGGSFALAQIIRRIVGQPRLTAVKLELSGLNVILLTVFALIAMDSVRARLFDTPLMVLGLTALTFVVAFAMMGLASLAALNEPPRDRMVLAMAAGTRNMGLMVAALGDPIPDFVWLYFALGQFPIYFLPWILQPVARRFGAAQT